MSNAPSAHPNLRRWLTAAAVSMFSLLVTMNAHGQITAPFLGEWKVTWQTEKGSYQAVMTLTEAGGNWQTANFDRHNACAGREVPIKVNSSTPTELRLQLQFSEVMQGCQNPPVVLKAGADGTVTGTRSKYELVLVKK